jgi:hypothetical protein
VIGLYFDGFLVSESFGFKYVIPWAKNSGNVLSPLNKSSDQVQLDQNSLAPEMRRPGNERVSVRQGCGYTCRCGTLNEANLLKTARTCCSLEA